MSAAAAHSATGMPSSALLHLGEPGRVLLHEFVVDGVAPDQRRRGSRPAGTRQRPGRTARCRSAISAVSVRRGSITISLRAGSLRIWFRWSRAFGKAVRDPGIGADHEQQVAMMDILGGVAGLAAEHVAVDPEIAGLLLRQRVEDMPRAERAQKRVGIGAAGVIALAAAAIERKALAAVAIDHLAQPRRRSPQIAVSHVDRVEPAVGASAQRRGQPVAVMRVVGNARRLVAEITLRFRVVAVAAHLGDPALVRPGPRGRN